MLTSSLLLQLPPTRPSRLVPSLLLFRCFPLALSSSFSLSPTSPLPPLRRARHCASILPHASPPSVLLLQLVNLCFRLGRLLPPNHHHLLLLPPLLFLLPRLLKTPFDNHNRNNFLPLLHRPGLPPRPRRRPPSLPTGLPTPLPLHRLVLHPLRPQPDPEQDRHPHALRHPEGLLRLPEVVPARRRPLRGIAQAQQCVCRRHGHGSSLAATEWTGSVWQQREEY